MQSNAKTVQAYLKELPVDRREAINAVRGVILANLPKGYEECMSYGMIGYVVPHSIYPKGYQCNPKLPLPFVNLGSQKNHMSLHLMCCYGDPKLKASFEKAWKDAGKKFDMGGGCVRFQKAGGCASGSDRPISRKPTRGRLHPPNRKNFCRPRGSASGKKNRKTQNSKKEIYEQESSEIRRKVLGAFPEDITYPYPCRRQLTQRLSAAKPQPKWRDAAHWGKSLDDESTNFFQRSRRPAGFS